MEGLKSIDQIIDECEANPVAEVLDRNRAYVKSNMYKYSLDDLERLKVVLTKLYEPIIEEIRQVPKFNIGNKGNYTSLSDLIKQ